ncbi:MAG: hypothetical protein KDE58_24585, partial [Caldilineaceae bacterium]|nr:hypothetical protein [Caldilineaceae bacterium]
MHPIIIGVNYILAIYYEKSIANITHILSLPNNLADDSINLECSRQTRQPSFVGAVGSKEASDKVQT